jgi:hypothetical protein
MRFKSFKSFNIGKFIGKPDGEDTAEVSETPAAQIAEIEEPLNNKAEDLKETVHPSGELADTANNSEEHENTPPQPHGPLGELLVEPEDELTFNDTDVSALLENGDEEVTVVKLGAEASAPAEEPKAVEAGVGADAPPEAEKEPIQEEASDSLHNLFSDEEEEENPLANLINSLPDVTTQELIDDLEEIQGIINEQQR